MVMGHRISKRTARRTTRRRISCREDEGSEVEGRWRLRRAVVMYIEHVYRFEEA